MTSLPKVKILEVSDVPPQVLGERWPRIRKFDSKLADYVEPIIEDVRGRGDDALIDFTMKFDGVELSADRLRVYEEDVERAYEKVSREQVSAIEFAKGRVEAFQRELLGRLNFEYGSDGVKVRSHTAPIRRVGCYIPGGEAAYPSSLVMTIVPAKVAGVPQVAICSPPRSLDEIDPLILVAADICGADEVYRVGGVQAVAALVSVP